MKAEYDVVKILRSTRQELDRIRKRYGYPSYNQAITALVERKIAKDEVMEELKEEVAKQASKVFAQSIYQLMLTLAKDIDKPISEITLSDMFTTIQKKSNAAP